MDSQTPLDPKPFFATVFCRIPEGVLGGEMAGWLSGWLLKLLGFKNGKNVFVEVLGGANNQKDNTGGWVFCLGKKGPWL